MKYRWLFFFLLAPLALFAQQGTLRGTVLDRATQRPLAGVSVQTADSSRGTTSDSSGAFTITAPTGSYNLTATAVGYKPQSLTQCARECAQRCIAQQPGRRFQGAGQ